MTLCWHANVGWHLLLLLISAHAAVLPMGINTGHSTETTTGPDYPTETTTGLNHPTETTIGSDHLTETGSGLPTETTTQPDPPTETVTETVLPTEITTGLSLLTEITSRVAHPTETTTLPVHPAKKPNGRILLTETTAEPVLLLETTIGPAHSTETTTGPAHSAETTTGPAHSAETTTEPAHSAETTTGPAHSAETTTGPAHSAETTTGPAHSAETTTGPAHSAETTTEPVLPTEISAGPALSIETTRGPALSAGTTTGPSLSAGTTADNEVVTIIAPVVSHKDPSLDESNDAINFLDASVTLRNTAVNQVNDMDKADMDKEFADTATRFESTKSIVDNDVEQKTKDKVVTKESDEPEELMSKPTEEQVHTEDNQTPIDEKITSNATPTKIPIHQPRILNYGGMIFKHDSNQENDNDGSRVNFGGPTYNREKDTTFTTTHQKKDSKINFGGPTKEETSIESLNEIFTLQETLEKHFSESKKAEKCKKQNMIYSAHDEKCHSPTSAGPCNPSTHWFVAQEDSWVGVCRPRLCTGQNTPFLYKGICSPIHGKCGQGERLYNDRFGEGFCGCEDGFLYHAREQKCYRENLRGPCVQGKQWVKKRGSWMEGVCKRRGCSGGRVKWEDGRCYKLQEGKAFQNCAASVEGDVKIVEEKEERVLGCFMEIGMRAIAPVFQGRRCRRGRTWSKYRKRCVRSYGWGR